MPGARPLMKPQAKTPVRTCTCKVVIGREGGGKRSEGRDVACIYTLYKGVKLSSAFLIQKKPCWFLGGGCLVDSSRTKNKPAHARARRSTHLGQETEEF